jgi:hypothetical protein
MAAFLWKSLRGYRLRPWRSPYLRWRIETYSGWQAEEIGFVQFWQFVWTRRHALGRFLSWTRDMNRAVPR